MKGIGIIIILVILIGGGWYLATNTAEENLVDVREGEQVEEGEMKKDGDAMMEEGDAMKEEGDAMMKEDDAEMSKEQTFHLAGSNYEYDVTEIRVKKGESVTVNLEVSEGLHDWVVDEFDAKTDRVSPGDQTSVTFVADQAGEFEYYCSVGNHRAQGMVGTLIVEE